MKLLNRGPAIALVVLLAFGTGELFAQQTLTKGNFETELNAALQAAKTDAGSEVLATLVRTCLLPQSGGENLTDVAPAYITDPCNVPVDIAVEHGVGGATRDLVRRAGQGFRQSIFVGGKLNSTWADD